jgi:chromate transport protein ChrA
MLIYAFMPFWERVRARAWVRCLLVGMNCSSIGLVFTACVQLYFRYVRVPGEAVVMLLTAALVAGYNVRAPYALGFGAFIGWVLFATDAGMRTAPRAREQPQTCVDPRSRSATRALRRALGTDV